MRAFFVASLALVGFTIACSSSDSTGTAGSGGAAGDGKIHPTPSGVHTTEDDACMQLVNERDKRLSVLGCLGTGETCPAFVRAQNGLSCVEYDLGTVQACVAMYENADGCDPLKAALADCIVLAYPGTTSEGCTP